MFLEFQFQKSIQSKAVLLGKKKDNMTVKEWFKKNWLIPVALIVVGLSLWAIIYFSKPENKIKFDFFTDKTNDLSSLLNMLEGRYASRSTEKGLGIYLDVPLTAVIKNKSARDLVLNNLGGSLSFEGQNILQTKSDSTVLQNVNVAGKSSKPITDTFQVLVNGSTIKYIKEIVKGNKPKLNYNLTAMIAGTQYNFRDSTVMNPDVPKTGLPDAGGAESGTGGGTGGRG